MMEDAVKPALDDREVRFNCIRGDRQAIFVANLFFRAVIDRVVGTFF